MSRIGKMPIAIPAGVTVSVAENNKVTVKIVASCHGSPLSARIAGVEGA